MTESVAPVERALVSVSDKTGLAGLARFLAARGVEILSTGGTAEALRGAGIAVVDVGARTGFPEIMDGRIKTLHPVVHGGILARRGDPAHRRAMAAHGIRPIDLVVVNLYPFEAAGAGLEDRVENIDVGGPALLRAAAKNHESVAVVTDSRDYAAVMDDMAANGGGTSAALRRRLAADAFGRTAAYDSAIAGWLADAAGEPFPRRFSLSGTLRQELRYGENPHQRAAFYAAGDGGGLAGAARLQGKELSYNNLNDAAAALALAAELDRPAAVVVKHAGPCGAAEDATLAGAWRKALACDPVSAFGGVVAVNRPVDAALAEALGDVFLEVVVAPGVDDDARAALARRGNLRVLATGGMPDPRSPGLALRTVPGGFLLQDRDAGRATAAGLEVATRRAPTEAEAADLLFAFAVAKHAASNAVVYARDAATIGIGAGQPSRVDSARIAAEKARAAFGAGAAAGAAAASDAFFPFADGLLAVADAGVTAVIQPGGSIRDAEVVAAADERGIAMVFTGLRHFRH